VVGVRAARIGLLATLLASAAVPAFATTLDYDAYVGSSRVGGAEVVIDRASDTYLIRGRLWAEGLYRWLTNWRTQFEAMGRFVEGTPIADSYSHTEQAKDKIKEVSLANGALTYVRNGEVRPLAPPHSKLDLVSALFLPNGCETSSDVHTGKDSYLVRLKRAEALPGSGAARLRCDFEVRGQDDERIDAVVWLGVVDGLTVPIRLDLRGALEGTLKLRA
jgi:hypothetical protein